MHRPGMCVPGADTDGDGVLDGEDNCPQVANEDQDNQDEDPYEMCDPDIDGDGTPNENDAFPTDPEEP